MLSKTVAMDEMSCTCSTPSFVLWADLQAPIAARVRQGFGGGTINNISPWWYWRKGNILSWAEMKISKWTWQEPPDQPAMQCKLVAQGARQQKPAGLVEQTRPRPFQSLLLTLRSNSFSAWIKWYELLQLPHLVIVWKQDGYWILPIGDNILAAKKIRSS